MCIFDEMCSVIQQTYNWQGMVMGVLWFECKSLYVLHSHSWWGFMHHSPFLGEFVRFPWDSLSIKAFTLDVSLWLAWTSFCKTVNLLMIWDTMTLMWCSMKHAYITITYPLYVCICEWCIVVWFRLNVPITKIHHNICRLLELTNSLAT